MINDAIDLGYATQLKYGSKHLFRESVEFSIVLGFEPGYFNTGDVSIEKMAKDVNSSIIEMIRELENKYSIYVSAITSPCYAVYHENFGCPESGEPCVKIEVMPNTYKFVRSASDVDKYFDATMELVENLKEKYKQYTVTVTARPVYMTYLEGENE